MCAATAIETASTRRSAVVYECQSNAAQASGEIQQWSGTRAGGHQGTGLAIDAAETEATQADGGDTGAEDQRSEAGVGRGTDLQEDQGTDIAAIPEGGQGRIMIEGAEGTGEEATRAMADTAGAADARLRPMLDGGARHRHSHQVTNIFSVRWVEGNVIWFLMRLLANDLL